MAQIKFGTDGWRAVIAEEFTFENVTLVSRATAQWMQKKFGASPKAVIGHDTRFLGRAFAERVACVLASYGIHVTFAETIAPTPAISWGTREFGCDAGIVITASHNPPQYNGFKIKANFGGPASPQMIAEVEQELDRLGEAPSLSSFEELRASGKIVLRDVRAEYMDMLRSRLDIAAIAASGIRMAHDAMFGAGRGVIRELIGSEQVYELRGDWNPGFHGQAPEPIERNLQMLSKAIVRESCAVGIANDGDADRVGMYDENGKFVDSHQILALLLKYLYEERGLRGDVVKTFSTTHMLNKMGNVYGARVHTLPIGFKYIGPLIVEEDILIGGEESGGVAVKGHIPERDGIYIGLLVVEMMVKRGKKLSELVQELFQEFGPHVARRIDLHTTEQKKQGVLDRLRAGGLEEISGNRVTEVQTLDGFKHITEHGWLLVRPSGTEPVLRIYSEAGTEEAADALIADAVHQLGVSNDAH